MKRTETRYWQSDTPEYQWNITATSDSDTLEVYTDPVPSVEKLAEFSNALEEAIAWVTGQ